MIVVDVRIKLCEPGDRLKAFCSATLQGGFVIRDLKILEGNDGKLFIAMPSRKLTDRCPNSGCGTKNHLRAKYCNECGTTLDGERATRGCVRPKLHDDICHPINPDARQSIQCPIIRAYRNEVEAAKLPGYVCRYGHDTEEDFERTQLHFSTKQVLAHHA